jgi:N-acetyl-1-D-myo-inositol-2-amino-2-deoxy-alpha-D-glucopyranoside deacetylase
LLVVTAHPDDEVLIAGGTLAACAAAGWATGVVCLTRGEQGPISDPRLATRETLGARRVRELSAACAELGVAYIECLANQDGNLKWSDSNPIVRDLTAIIDDRRPAAVVTFGEDGLYYHPDHIATYELTARAVQRAEDPPALYRSVLPPTLMRDLVSDIERRGLPIDLWGIAPEAFGSEDDDQSFIVDVRRFADRKLRALRAHRTQLPPEHAMAAIPPDLAERFLGFERFAKLSGHGNWLSEALGGA